MLRRTDDQPASRVVEEPKRSVLPYFVVAAVAAVAFWSMQQQSIPDPATSDRPVTTHATRDQPGPHGAKGDIRTLFSADDYPADAQRRGEEGSVQAELAVNARGRVTECAIVRSSGHSSLDNATCQILQRRARFFPARDVNGDPVPDTVTTPPITWRLED